MMLANRFPRGFPRHELVGGGAIHIVFLVAVLALFVLLAVWLVTNIRRNGLAVATPAPVSPAGSAGDTALREARMRYARGELTRDQFLEISGDLGGEPPPA